MAPVTAPRRGRAPDDLVKRAWFDLFDRVADTRDAPPQLGPSIAAVQDAMEREDIDTYIDELLNLGAAAISSIVVTRAAEEDA